MRRHQASALAPVFTSSIQLIFLVVVLLDEEDAAARVLRTAVFPRPPQPAPRWQFSPYLCIAMREGVVRAVSYEVCEARACVGVFESCKL